MIPSCQYCYQPIEGPVWMLPDGTELCETCADQLEGDLAHDVRLCPEEVPLVP